MHITERKLRSVIRSVLFENEMKDLQIKKEHLMNMFKNPVDIANVLNSACSKVRPKKMTNISYYIDDEKVVEEAMLDKRMTSLYGARDRYDSKKSLGREDRNKIKGALRSILAHCKNHKKISCIIDKDDVLKITEKFIDYDHIGMSGPLK